MVAQTNHSMLTTTLFTKLKLISGQFTIFYGVILSARIASIIDFTLKGLPYAKYRMTHLGGLPSSNVV